MSHHLDRALRRLRRPGSGPVEFRPLFREGLVRGVLFAG
ncbi:hypothetical protein B005_1086 [Nocardiopsis alba ATCC BAA-2165]|uniref:Uncharacterized protein n=1 Tax=Nocardiopsis alba (strain ATCC BAA-2165 / BE74) TaxID=1205910 RepID=J7KZA8_NOCAA|nr:hypothetical protein B005_1086 [Nocardiopsis alba ATCC BAA-2165]